MNLCHYLIGGVVYLLFCWSLLAGLDNRDEKPCPAHLQLDVATMAQRRLSFLEGVVTGEVDLVVVFNSYLVMM